MRKSGWAAATGLGSLVLLLAACGGSSGSNSAAGAASGQPSASSGSAPAAAASSVSAASTASQGGGSTAKARRRRQPHKSVGPQPSGDADERSIPPVGTTVMIVQKSAIGFVLAEANHDVVYIYDKDKKGGKPTCVGTCAQTWLLATGVPRPAPGPLPGPVRRRHGARAASSRSPTTACPLYTLKGGEAAADDRQRPGRRLARGQLRPATSAQSASPLTALSAPVRRAPEGAGDRRDAVASRKQQPGPQAAAGRVDLVQAEQARRRPTAGRRSRGPRRPAASASCRVMPDISSGFRAVMTPPPRITGVARPVRPRRRMAVMAMTEISSASRLTTARPPGHLRRGAQQHGRRGRSGHRWPCLVDADRTSSTRSTPKWLVR